MLKNISILRIFYIFLSALIFLTAILTPYIITTGISVFKEEMVEGALIFVLFIVGYGTTYLYKKELSRIEYKLIEEKKSKEKFEQRLTDAFAYIGSVNAQLEVIQSIFSEMKNPPKNKNEMKQTIEFLASRVLGIVPSAWVLLRIIESEKEQTLREYLESREAVTLVKHKISNKGLLAGEENDYYDFVSSAENSLNTKTFCIFAKGSASKEQRVLLKAIANQLEMLFIIFDSRYYKYREINIKNKNNTH